MFLRKAFKYFIVAYLLAAQVALADTIITGSVPYVFVPGTTISSSQVNADLAYLISQVNANGAKSGVNSSITALLGLTTPLNLQSGGSPVYTATSATGGTANAQTVANTVPAVSSYSLSSNNIVCFSAGATNTSALTFQVGSTAVSNVKKVSLGGLVALVGGEVVSGQAYCAYWDSTQYVLLNIPQGLGPQTSIASNTTTDIGVASSNNILVTGTTTITSFGSGGNVVYPVFLVQFSGVLTITYNGTSLITPSGANITTAAGDAALLLYLGSGNWRILNYMPASPPAYFKSTQVFTSSGTWTKPSNRISTILVIGTGGGAGGTDAASGGGAPGGGAGATCVKVLNVIAIASEAVTVGTGGSGGTSSGAGSAGNDTVFGATVFTAGGGAAGAAFSTSGAEGGLGGTCTGGDINIIGGDGSGSIANNSAGAGGSSFWGGGGGGRASSGNGFSGKAFGSGGGGGAGSSSTSGGAGKDGIVWVLEFGY